MSFRLVPKSVTLNDLERRSGRHCRYFSEIGSTVGSMGVGAGLYMYDVVVIKFTFTISPPDEFLLCFVTQSVSDLVRPCTLHRASEKIFYQFS